MNEFKSIKIDLDCVNPVLSEIYINGEKILNVMGLKVAVDVDGDFTVEFITHGDELASGSRHFVDVFLHPNCPKCGYIAPTKMIFTNNRLVKL